MTGLEKGRIILFSLPLSKLQLEKESKVAFDSVNFGANKRE